MSDSVQAEMSLSPPEHESTAAIDEAANWLINTPRHQRPGAAVPLLRARFGLTVVEACAAIREANLRLVKSA